MILLLWSASIVVPRRLVHCLLVSLPLFLSSLRATQSKFQFSPSVFPLRRKPVTQHFCSVCFIRHPVVRRSPTFPYLPFRFRFCRASFAQLLLLRPLRSRSLPAFRPSTFCSRFVVCRKILFPAPTRFPFCRCSSTQSSLAGRLSPCLLSSCLKALPMHSLIFVTHFRRVPCYTVIIFLLFGGLIIKLLSFGFGHPICLDIVLP